MKFYNDQKSVTQKMALSKEVDIDYEQEIEQQRKIEQKIKEKDQMERNAINDSDDEVTVLESSRCDQDTLTNVSLKRSGLTRTTKSVADVSTQTVIVETVKPLRSGVRNIKTALALSCSRAGITAEQVRKAFQTTSEVFFGMKYHLSPQDTQAEPLAKKPLHHLIITADNKCITIN